MEPPEFLTGRTALVTGGSRGLGRAIAVALAHAGADVAVASRTPAGVESVLDEIRSAGRRAMAVEMDVSDVQQVEDGVRNVVDELGALDVLVNNAGGGAGLTPAEELSPTDFQRVIDVNLTGTFVACRAAFPAMRARGLREDRQRLIPGGHRRAAGRSRLLRGEGRRLASHPVPCGRVGHARDQRQRGRPDVHPDAGDGAGAFRRRVSRRCRGAHRCAAPNRRACRRLRRSRLPLLAGRVADHRRDARDRRRLDDPLSSNRESPVSGAFSVAGL